MYEYIDVTSMQNTHQEEKTVKELYSMFYEELPEYKQEINSLVDCKDYNGLYTLMHKLHGSCCYCYAPRLKMLVSLIEEESRINNISDENISLLNKHFDAVMAELEDYLGK